MSKNSKNNILRLPRSTRKDALFDSPARPGRPTGGDVFKAMVDDAMQGILVHQRHKPLYVNRAWAELHGCTVDEVMAMPRVDVFWHESEKGRLDNYTNDRLAGQWAPTRYRYRARQKGGKAVWVEQFVHAVEWRGEKAIQSTIIDVDAQEKQADELRQRQQSMEHLIRQRTEALERSNTQRHLYESIVDQVSDRISVIDTDYRYRMTNQANLGFRQQSLDWFVGRHLSETIGDAQFEESAKALLDRCFDGCSAEIEHSLEAPDGKQCYIMVRGDPFREPDGRISGAIVSIREVTDATKMREQLRLHASVAEQVSDRISVIDTNYRYRLTNRANLDYHQKPLQAFLGHHVSDITGERHFLDKAKPEFDRCFAGETIKHLRGSTGGDGRSRLHDVLLEPYREADGRISGAVVTLRDITEAQRLSERLAYQVDHDELTGLINRRAFERHLNDAIGETANNCRSAAFCFIDLDQFKIINDTVGHLVGDRLLKQVARLLEDRVRDGDVLARLGGDEFGLLLRGCSLRRAQRAAEKLNAVLNDYRFCHEGHVFEVGASMGIAVINRHTLDFNEVMSQADLACYAAKDEGRNRVQVYEKRDASLSRRREEMQQAGRIRAALDQDQFTLFGQPIEAVLESGNEPNRVEILLRMTDDTNELIMPSSFIPAAERYGFMGEIDRWVIKRTVNYLATSRTGPASFQVNVNLSGATLNDEALLSFVYQILEDAEVPAHRLCFEITETAAIHNFIKTEAFIRKLRDLGCQFALDDFGTGLSSLNYLKRLPVDYLKIDRTFIRDIRCDRNSRAMVAAIHQMAKAFDIKTIAEGVEDHATLAILKDIGTDFVQGFEVGTPKPLSHFGGQTLSA